jgi:hypothetical protein
MVTFRISTVVKEDRRVVVLLPPDVPTGEAELMVTVDSKVSGAGKPARTSLAQWAEANAEDWGSTLNSEDVNSFTGRRF